MEQNIKEAIERLKNLKFDVVVISEKKKDHAVCAVMSTAVDYHNPWYAHQRGWEEARRISIKNGDDVLYDIKLLCEALENAE